MSTVADILKTKADSVVHTIAPTASVLVALQRMADKGIGALLVVDATDAIVGIVTERDYARKVMLKGRTSVETRVNEIMTSAVLCVRPHQSVEECMAIMTERHLRHLPVMEENGPLLGLVSIGDLVKSIISEQQFTIAQLQHYIQGHHS